ncbi:MAG: NAD-glutamate dehydrogenase, partial [Gemmatimonadota bacterium]|nr:NAD-glutamate dehydrogenase [Gemmatimonadota bacterium]
MTVWRSMSSTSTDTLADKTATSVDDLCEFLARTHDEKASPLCEFARLFFAQVPRALLAERRMDQLAAVTESAFRFLERSRPSQVNVEVTDPEEDSMAWEATATVIRVEVGDRPFIVDTIRELLAEEKIDILAFLYPVFRVERGADGEILEVGEPTAEGDLEALIHC